MRSINFEFLRTGRPTFADLGMFAERYVTTDSQSCTVKVRTLLEQVVETIYDEQRLPQPYVANLFDLLNESVFEEVVPRVVRDKMHGLRIVGNKAAHGKVVPPQQVRQALRDAHAIAAWFHITFDGGKLAEIAPFQDPAKISPPDSKGRIKREKKALAEELARQEARLAGVLEDLERERTARQTEVRAAQAELDALRVEAERAAKELEFSEEQTRRFLIDTQLVDSGWDVGPNGQSTDQVGQEVLLHGLPDTKTGDGYADYVLWAANGLPLAVIEAKRTSKDAGVGRTQAWNYANSLAEKHGVRPVIFYTNGIDIWIWDDVQPVSGTPAPPRKIYGFYSKDSLEYLHFQRANKEQLELVEPSVEIAGRMYQLEAVKRVNERFSNGHRKALVVQATGTGKTRVAISICDVLSRAKWAKRILFLCDRRELRKQAAGAFKEFLPSEPRVRVTRKTSGDRNKRIYLATYPAMMTCFETFDVGFFDLIIADESHRSIYNKYRDLFLYFDAFQVGLTATPQQLIDHNTYAMFGCENKAPTVYYSLEEAINNDPPYLNPPRVVKVTTRFQREGIHYKQLTDEQKQQLEAQAADAEEFDHSRADLDKRIFNKDTSRTIIRNLMENGIRDTSGSLPGKSIIFARGHKHAVHLSEVFTELYPKYGGNFCRVIDNYDTKADQLIEDLKDPDNDLTIAISVDMLDTGIDIPELVNLVFAKPVKSYVKFWQMIGRGTRLRPNLFGPGKDKTEFLIFDHWANFDYFEEEYTEVNPPGTKSLMELVFVRRVNLAAAALEEMDEDVFQQAIALIGADINTLQQSKAIEVRDQWRNLQALSNKDVLGTFAAATRAALIDIVGPLMRWADIRGHEDAYRFDLLIAELQVELIGDTGKVEDLKGLVLNDVNALRKNLNPVKAKADTIKLVRTKDFWEGVTITDLEQVRLELRGIMKYKAGTQTPALDPRTIDVKDSDEERVKHVPTFDGQELIAYRHRVEGVLHEHFEHNHVLVRIRSGEAVSDEDLSELSRMVLRIDPLIDLKVLPIQLNTKGDLHRALRSVVGLDVAAVDQAFTGFAHRYLNLTATQLRFLSMLKAHICANGGLEIERLYEAPFTTINSDGVDGVFAGNDEVIDDLLDLVGQFKLPEIPRGQTA
jgi:type I restriction enzyme, R subunit